MEAVREKWTDERLDDLNKKVDDGFKRIDERFASIDQRFIHLERTMTQWFVALVGIQVTFFVATVAFIAAQT